MAPIAQSLLASSSRSTWLWTWLRDDLSPNPGRGLLVARMVTAATLVMIISVIFRLPYAPYAALFAMNISRDSLEGTRRAVRAIVIGFFLAGRYLLFGARFVIGDPLLRFIWIVATLFLVFYGISASSNFAVWMRFGYMAVITIPLWDQHISAQARMNGLLWAIGMLTMASAVALLLEIAYVALRRGDDLTDALVDRLAGVEELLRYYANGLSIEASTESAVTCLAMLGTSGLRGLLRGSNKSSEYAQQMVAFVSLVGRLVDLAANLPKFVERVSDADRERIGALANRIAQIGHDVKNNLRSTVAERIDDGIVGWASALRRNRKQRC